MLKTLKIILSLYLLTCSLSVYAIYPASIQEETSAYVVDIKYPQGFKDPRINAAMQAFIEKTREHFFSEKIQANNDVPADAPGKTGLNITYSLPYKTMSALSVKFMISIYLKGAAHPINTVEVLNFMDGDQIQLADLFRPETDYLKPIADFCQKNIIAKNFGDKKWMEEGTKPIDKNYRIWSFSSKGIDIIFDTYQVAAYVYGPQTVEVPFSQFASLLKPEIAQSVWGH